MKREIDEEYFRRYAGGVESYGDTYNLYSRVEECMSLVSKYDVNRFDGIAVLGTATGRVVGDLQAHFQVPVIGCEISSWAVQQSRPQIRQRIANQDMREFIWQCRNDGLYFDLVFTNALVYLEEEELDFFLANLAETAGMVHFHSSFLGACCPDPYRNILRSYDWWNQRFEKAGFRAKSPKRVNARYLWRNTKPRKG